MVAVFQPVFVFPRSLRTRRRRTRQKSTDLKSLSCVFKKRKKKKKPREERSREEHKAAMDSRVAQPDPGMAWIHTLLLAPIQHPH